MKQPYKKKPSNVERLVDAPQNRVTMSTVSGIAAVPNRKRAITVRMTDAINNDNWGSESCQIFHSQLPPSSTRRSIGY